MKKRALPSWREIVRFHGDEEGKKSVLFGVFPVNLTFLSYYRHERNKAKESAVINDK